LDFARQILAAWRIVAKDDESLDDLTAGRVGNADDSALSYVRMLKENLLDLLPGNIVTGTDDHIVRARMVPEKAVRIRMERIAGQVPAAPDIGLLPIRNIQITATDPSTHCQTSDRA
jgi:hypothetical protein